jgi:SAM-dependent methyltransferase
MDDVELAAEWGPLVEAGFATDPYGGFVDLLTDVDPGLPVLDIGAGSGRRTAVLADAVPDAEVVAVESSAAQRIRLMTRLAQRPDLQHRVTVIPQDLFTANLPDRWGGGIAFHLLCQLDVADRRRFLELLADRLAPDASMVMEWHYDAEAPRTVADTLRFSITLGRREYQHWFTSTPAGSDATWVKNTYRILHDGTVVAEQVRQREMPLIRGPALLKEIADAGLSSQRKEDNLLVIWH